MDGETFYVFGGITIAVGFACSLALMVLGFFLDA